MRTERFVPEEFIGKGYQGWWVKDKRYKEAETPEKAVSILFSTHVMCQDVCDIMNAESPEVGGNAYTEELKPR